MFMANEDNECKPIDFTQLGDFRIKFKDDMIMFKNDHHIDVNTEKNPSFEGIKLMARLQGLFLIDIDDIYEQQVALLVNKSANEVKAMQDKWFPIQVFDYCREKIISIQVRVFILAKKKISKESQKS